MYTTRICGIRAGGREVGREEGGKEEGRGTEGVKDDEQKAVNRKRK